MKPHGTLSRYTQHKCRCDLCRAVVAAYQRERYAARKAALPPEVKLGQPVRQPMTPILDAAVSKVGQDFPSLGALVRAGWTGAA